MELDELERFDHAYGGMTGSENGKWVKFEDVESLLMSMSLSNLIKKIRYEETMGENQKD